MDKPEQKVRDFLVAEGWSVSDQPDSGPGGPDLRLEKGPYAYVAEVKRPAESRADRVIALFAQAILQAQTYARHQGAKPLAILSLKEVPDALIAKIDRFREQFAADVAFGLIGDDGRHHFAGAGLESLNRHEPKRRNASIAAARIQAHNLFSDLNQWMLKVLLAPEIPPELLSAPRGEYKSGSDLATAAQVSAMSASRFLFVLRKEGFVADERVIRLVRREELFRRWQASLTRSSLEAPFKFLIPGAGQLHKFLMRHKSCLGLFDAAEAIGLGHVSGTTPYIYVPQLGTHSGLTLWKGIVPARDGDTPGLILRQPLAPESVFRGAVMRNDIPVTDVIQTWLDVSIHPARGREQAEVIENRILGRVIRGSA